MVECFPHPVTTTTRSSGSSGRGCTTCAASTWQPRAMRWSRFTGISGSGKSSLAFGTIYAEAQRRYFESVAPYARRLLLPAGAPKVDDITGSQVPTG
jgi:hypothetical protein